MLCLFFGCLAELRALCPRALQSGLLSSRICSQCCCALHFSWRELTSMALVARTVPVLYGFLAIVALLRTDSRGQFSDHINPTGPPDWPLPAAGTLQLLLLSPLHPSGLTSLPENVGACTNPRSTLACLVLSDQCMRTVEPAQQNTDPRVARACADQRPEASMHQAGKPLFGNYAIYDIPGESPRVPA